MSCKPDYQLQRRPRRASSVPASDQVVTAKGSLHLGPGVRRVAAMLDLDPDRISRRRPLPPGWHFVLLGADTRRSALRADGFPGLGVPMPDLGLERLMLGGRIVRYRQPIPIGSTVRRTGAIRELIERRPPLESPWRPYRSPMNSMSKTPSDRRSSKSRPMCCWARQGRIEHRGQEPPVHPAGDRSRLSRRTRRLLFQYSALGFNSHKIHLDRAHARDVEGFPDLVVNGGLATLLLCEFLRDEIGVEPASMKVRHFLPLFCNRQMTLTRAARRAGVAASCPGRQPVVWRSRWRSRRDELRTLDGTARARSDERRRGPCMHLAPGPIRFDNISAIQHLYVQYDEALVFSLNLTTGNLRHEERSERTRHSC